jgi:hypothetical protein
VRDQIGPVAAFKLACVVDRLPKTRSGKILRATMVKIADGEDFKMPATIDDPAILDEIREALAGLGGWPFSVTGCDEGKIFSPRGSPGAEQVNRNVRNA